MGHRQQTREKILEAAEQVFAEKGYHDTAVDEIVRYTSVSKGGLYFHFPSKEGLFFAVLDRLADKLVVRIESRMAGQQSTLKRVDVALSTVMESLGQRRQLARILLLQGYSMGNAFEKKRVEIFSRFALLVKQSLDQAIAEGTIHPVDTGIAALVWLGATNELIIRWLLTGEPDPQREGLPVLRTLLFRSIGVETEELDKAESAIIGTG